MDCMRCGEMMSLGDLIREKTGLPKEVARVLWASRHEMSVEQKKDLTSFLGREIQVTTANLVWQATADEMADRAANRERWNSLLGEYDVITGVFPPVAVEGFPWSRTEDGEWPPTLWDMGKELLTPVSRQAPELRVGEGPIPFQHLRWAKVLPD